MSFLSSVEFLILKYVALIIHIAKVGLLVAHSHFFGKLSLMTLDR